MMIAAVEDRDPHRRAAKRRAAYSPPNPPPMMTTCGSGTVAPNLPRRREATVLAQKLSR